ncbi:MFS transporter [Nonomuraea fuscirosea]|uniref:MFS transporter n=1 Tax=Nonomuraea fuscirosea TaxID=1291556 RepID=UPI002DDC364E|nr:MFS transporter [Nonomuraea fuscirosea]WSA48753.1 MFS transporter [Nonomuraea fuscirosea]
MLLLATCGVAVAQTIVLAVLPVFTRTLDVSATGATWLLTAFMLASAVATPVAGRLGDQFGHRRLLVIGLAFLLVGSVVAAVSTPLGSYPGVVTGRVLQGLSGGVFPCAFGLARQTVPAERLGGVIAALSTMFGFGGALGMVAAGPLADVTGPATLFWLVAVLAMLALAAMVRVPSPSTSPARAGRVDLGGAALLAGALVALLLASRGRGDVRGGHRPAVVRPDAHRPRVRLRLLPGPDRPPDGPDGRLHARRGAARRSDHPFPAREGRFPDGRGPGRDRSGRSWPAARAHRGTARLVRSSGSGLRPRLASLGGLVIEAAGQEETGAATRVNTILRTVGGAVGSVLATVLVSSATGPRQPPAPSGYTAAFVVSGAVALCAAAVIAGRGAVSPRPGRRADEELSDTR